MSISLTTELKNNVTMSFEAKGQNNTTWDEANYSWDNATGTWDNPGMPIIEESKNTISLSFENKL